MQMDPEQDAECYNRIRFAMDDADGSLRFRRIGVEGGVYCKGVLKRLEAYLKKRPLRDIDMVADIAKRIGPDKVQLNTVARPPTEDFATAVPEDQMNKLTQLFEVETEIVADFRKIHEAVDIAASCEDVLTLLRRRPCTVEDIASGLGIHRNEVVKHLGELVQEGRVTTHMTNNKNYFQARQETTT